VAGGAKNHRFSEQVADPTRPSPDAEIERRRGPDRRTQGLPHHYYGTERRRGPRREAELSRPLWRRAITVALAAGLGVTTALVWDTRAMDDQSSEVAPNYMRGETMKGEIASVPTPDVRSSREALAQAQAMRDRAEALTPAEVALDERAHERWTPQIAAIEAARENPDTPAEIREELEATLLALARAGLIATRV